MSQSVDGWPVVKAGKRGASQRNEGVLSWQCVHLNLPFFFFFFMAQTTYITINMHHSLLFVDAERGIVENVKICCSNLLSPWCIDTVYLTFSRTVWIEEVKAVYTKTQTHPDIQHIHKHSCTNCAIIILYFFLFVKIRMKLHQLSRLFLKINLPCISEESLQSNTLKHIEYE